MKIRLFAILLCTVIAGVSCIHEFPVTDHSFDFTGEIIYDSETDQHRLTLTCKKKSATDQFDIVFHVDGENVITLTDMDGVTHQGWFSESFADTDSRTYILSEAPVGKHLLDIPLNFLMIFQKIYNGSIQIARLPLRVCHLEIVIYSV